MPLRGFECCLQTVEIEVGEAVEGTYVSHERAIARQCASIIYKKHPAQRVELLLQHHAEGGISHHASVAHILIIEIAARRSEKLCALGTAGEAAAVVCGSRPQPEVDQRVGVDVVVEIQTEVAVEGAVTAVSTDADDGR